MPIRNINEEEIRKIAAKYIYSVRRDPATIPDIHKIIEEAIKGVAPNRDFDPADISSVVSKLKGKHIINDKVINEAAKLVVDHSAMEELKFMIGRNAKQLKKKLTPKEVDAIIKKGKLDPYTATLPQIKKAVNDFFSFGRPLEFATPTELQDLVRAEMSKAGAVDERDVNAVVAKYIEKADQEKPIDPAEVQRLIQSHMALRTPTARPTEKEKQKPDKQTNVKQGTFVPPKDPKNLTFFEKIRIKFQRYGIKSLTKESRFWLTDEVSSLKRVDRQKFLTEGQTAAEAFIGKMFMFFYDAKTKKKLPYWDKFPLIFVIELYNDGWLGLNLHYLDRTIRMRLFDKLLKFANDKSLDKITKLRLSYALLKNVAQFPEVRPCIKRYLAEYTKSQLLTVQPVDWEIALFLPVEQFQKEKKETVWMASKKKIRQLKKVKVR
jgi:hypothetical protein